MSSGIKSKCLVCGKDYSEDLFSLLYCLIDDICICNKCVKAKKVKVKTDGSWQCPKCGKWLTVEESRLFKQE